jgi:hypothetical protein
MSGFHVPVTRVADLRGLLTAIEFIDLPWQPHRAYFLSKGSMEYTRGGHAHKELSQFFVALDGSWNLELSDGSTTQKITMDSTSGGHLVPPGLWRDVIQNSATGTLCVLADQSYKESDYIRDYEEFKRWKLNSTD